MKYSLLYILTIPHRKHRLAQKRIKTLRASIDTVQDGVIENTASLRRGLRLLPWRLKPPGAWASKTPPRSEED